MKLFAVNKYIYLERRYILQDQSYGKISLKD